MLRYSSTERIMQPDELHPQGIFDEERRLAKEFVTEHPSCGRIDSCPVSGNPRSEVLFSKWGQQYSICPETWTLSLGEIPGDDILEEYFNTSDLAEYRSSEEYQRIAGRLRVELWRGQKEWHEAAVYRYLGSGSIAAADWGTKFSGWIEFLRSSPALESLGIVDPLPPVQPLKGNLPYDAVFMNDAFQREANPEKLLVAAASCLRDSGLLFIACRSGSGFDILSLREHSDSIFPFDHICLPSPSGIVGLLEKTGFEVLEESTPGRLDMALLSKGRIPRDQYFQRYLTQSLPQSEYPEFQAFLQRFRLSSHLRVIARKKETT